MAVAEMIPDSLVEFGLSQGVLGAVVIALGYYVVVMRKDLKDARDGCAAQIAAKDAYIYQIQESRVAEAKLYLDMSKTMQATLDAFLMTIRITKP